MSEDVRPSWKAARQRLHDAGLSENDAYLSALIPLVDVALSDGTIQPEEQAELERAAHTVVDRLNHLAGYAAFSFEQALSLIERLRHMPLSQVAQLTAQVHALELESSDRNANELAFSRIIASCLRVAMATRNLENGKLVHFCREERLRIQGIMQALAVTRRYTPSG
jgi:hypothetical protein